MSQRIIIKSKITNEYLENILEELKNGDIQTDLQLPLRVEYRGFGILPALFLILFTWMREKRGNVFLDINPTDKDVLKKYAQSYIGYMVLSTIWTKREVVNLEGNQLKKFFIPFTSQMHEKIDMLDNSLPNREILIPCFDHYSNLKGLSHWFYTSDFDFAEAPSHLEHSLFRIFEILGKINRNVLVHSIKESFDDLLRILWELLRNTNDHARKDYLNETQLSPNTRGLFIRMHQSSKNNFVDQADHDGIRSYYKRTLPDGNNIFILEISVFDSGPGLVKRFLGKDWTGQVLIDEDIVTIKKCLVKGQTSVKDLEGINKGFGLDDVLNLLNKKKGFLKIRTGRVSLYRDLNHSPYKPTKNIQEVELFDWKKINPQEFTEMPYTEGTAITLAYPLNIPI